MKVPIETELLALLNKYKDLEEPQDILNQIAETARLLSTTDKMREMIRRDIFGLFEKDENGRLVGEGARLSELMKVKRFDEVRSLDGFTSVDCRVDLTNQGLSKGHRPMKNPLVQLHFAFRRQPLKSSPPVDHNQATTPTTSTKKTPGNSQGGGRKRPRVESKESSSSHGEEDHEEGEEEDEEDSFGTALSYTISASAGYRKPPVCLVETVVRAWGDGPSRGGHVSEEEWVEKEEELREKEDKPDICTVNVDGEGLEALVDWVGSHKALGPVEMLHLLMSLPFWEEEFDWIDVCLEGLFEDDDDEDA